MDVAGHVSAMSSKSRLVLLDGGSLILSGFLLAYLSFLFFLDSNTKQNDNMISVLQASLKKTQTCLWVLFKKLLLVSPFCIGTKATSDLNSANIQWFLNTDDGKNRFLQQIFLQLEQW